MNYVIIALAGLFVGVGCAVRNQSSDVAGPSRLVYQGTAIRDSMDVDAGRSQISTQTAPGGSVHPGTAILDSMGIFAGEPIPPSAVNGNAQAASTEQPN